MIKFIFAVLNAFCFTNRVKALQSLHSWEEKACLPASRSLSRAFRISPLSGAALIETLQAREGGLYETDLWLAHDLEAWTCTFDNWQVSFLWPEPDKLTGKHVSPRGLLDSCQSQLSQMFSNL